MGNIFFDSNYLGDSLPNLILGGFYSELAEHMATSSGFPIHDINATPTDPSHDDILIGKTVGDISPDKVKSLGVDSIERIPFSIDLLKESSSELYPLVLKKTYLNNGRGKFLVQNGQDLAKVCIAFSILGEHGAFVRSYEQIIQRGSIWNCLDLIDDHTKNTLAIEKFYGDLEKPESFRVVLTGTGKICYALKLTSNLAGMRDETTTTSKQDFFNTFKEPFTALQIEELLLSTDSLLHINSPEFRSNSGSTSIMQLDLNDSRYQDLFSSAQKLNPLFRNQLFVGIDFIFFEGKFHLLEINSWPDINMNHLGYPEEKDRLKAYKLAFERFYLEQ